MNPIVDIIYGGQYGSEAKRLFIEYYVNKYKPDAIVSNFGPNSGGFVSDGGKWATFAMGFDGLHLLSSGSIINYGDFIKEHRRLPEGARVLVHKNACIVTPKAIENEKRLVKIGSTMTGTMAAVNIKMARNLNNQNLACVLPGIRRYSVSNDMWNETIRKMKRILLVVPQGHSLSLNFGFHPYCTSRNTSPQQGLADAGIPIQWVNRIIGCFRTFPIRVANRYDELGNMIGYSGGCYPDQREMTWDEVGQSPEYTSVSNNIRRVFSFSMNQFIESCRMNGCTDVFMNFLNYLQPKYQNMFLKDISHNLIKNEGIFAKLSYFGYGPTINDINNSNRWGI